MGWLILVLIVMWILFKYSIAKTEERKLINSIPMNYVKGLEYMAENSKVMLAQWDNEIEINQKLKLPLSRVNGSEVVYGTHLSTGSNSPLGRAVAGGLLFGGIGAIVGAVSGATTSTTSKPRYFLIINYMTKDNQEANIVLSGDIMLKKQVLKISDYINSRVGYKRKYDNPDNIEI